MKHTIRDIRQKEFAEAYINSKRRKGILDLCPRFGKIRTTWRIFEAIKPKKVLITYPENVIETSWRKEFRELGYENPDITYVNHVSLHKYEDEVFDMFVIDEIHELSENQTVHCKRIMEGMQGKNILGLSGSIGPETEKRLWYEMDMRIISSYSVRQGIEEGIISDFTIKIIVSPLDNFKKQFKNKKGMLLTEKKRFDDMTWVINSKDRAGQDAGFLRLTRAKYLQSSPSKIETVKSILEKLRGKRILVFTGSKESCKKLGIPHYFSGMKSREEFDAFTNGEGNHFAVINIGNTGVTYRPLDMILISYFTANPEDLLQRISRALAVEYDNPDKKTNIFIISSNEPVELNWLKKALYFIEESKIDYITKEQI